MEILSDTFDLLSDQEELMKTKMDLDIRTEAWFDNPNSFSTEEYQALLDEHGAFNEKLERETETLKNLLGNKN